LSSLGDLRGIDASGPGVTRSAKSPADSRFGDGIHSSQTLLADPLQRTPYSEKMKWSVDDPSVLQQKFNSSATVNANSALFHQPAAGGADSGPFGHLYFNCRETASMRLEDAGWSVVKPKFWWRKNFANPRRSSEKASSHFKLKLHDKCYNCLSPGHLAFCCSVPSRCWFCLLPGHQARTCPRRGAQRKLNPPYASLEPGKHSLQGIRMFNYSQQQYNSCTEHGLQKQEQQLASFHSLPPRSLKKTYLQALQESPGRMEARYLGDPRGRPARASFAISATGPIRCHRDDLISKAVVCSFDGNSLEVDSLFVGDMLREKFNLQHGQYQLVKHFPEQFLIIFSDPRSKQWALDRRFASYHGRVFHFGDWSEDSYARKTSFEFRVKVRVEGIPSHYWGEDVVARALGRSCAIQFVQESSRRRERTRSFGLWAWCSDPYDIPKEVWLTITEPDKELPY
jgi:hypothetical protein